GLDPGLHRLVWRGSGDLRAGARYPVLPGLARPVPRDAPRALFGDAHVRELHGAIDRRLYLAGPCHREMVMDPLSHPPTRLVLLALGVLTGSACERSGTGPSSPAGVDEELRQQLALSAVVPLGPVESQDPALVELGRALFFDRILS